jgi:hypothetical protein
MDFVSRKTSIPFWRAITQLLFRSPQFYVTKVFTKSATEYLKYAYDECTDNTVKESMLKAFMALVQLDYVLGNSDDELQTEDSCDPSEYCEAI